MTEGIIIYLLRKSMDWFLYDNGLRHKRAKKIHMRQINRSNLLLTTLQV